MVKNPRVFLDISIGNRTGGRVVFELFADITPRTAENFRALCTGEYGVSRTTRKRLCYEGCSFFRSSKNLVQAGDLHADSGAGGESIYGPTFNDEDFTRRHTQAGILSMANKGRNSNGSQFMVLLKRAPQFDGRNIVFGQVVDGMDVIRAIAQVPTSLDERPRVPITIVGCGQVDRKTRNQADPHLQVQRSIADMTEEAAPTGVKVPAATQAKSILAGKQGGAAVPDDSEGSGKRRHPEEGDEGAATRPARNEKERKLFELRLRMNQCRSANNKEVVEEQKRVADPEYAKRKAEERHKQALEKEEGATGKEGREVGQKEPRAGSLPDGKAHLLDTLEAVEARESKKKKTDPDTFGWDVFNQDSLARAHEKRLKHLEFDQGAYDEQKQELAASNSVYAGLDFKATEAAKDRLQSAMDKMEKKKKDFSRRRNFVSEEDCNFINERNRFFNKKMERAFGAYTTEARQNLERGTAL
mmetsp:Transcript_58390/g.126320  ORF Transcript_58390/g.126320 Transcript_58390/m.126320 type:complete len:472 (+) Transcript_58390:65-1480(+)